MSTRSADYIDAIDHLPAEGMLVLQDVSWQDYEQLLEDLGARPDLRGTYDAGRLEILMISRKHDKYKRVIEQIIDILAEEFDLEMETFGSATWKRERDLKGIEGDSCYYIKNAKRVIGRDDDIDTNVDPLPDLFIEVEVTHRSLRKFPIYAAFGVPEIWRYDVKHKQALIYELRENSYAEVLSSPSFPILTGEVLANFIEQFKTSGSRIARTAFRQWIKTK